MANADAWFLCLVTHFDVCFWITVLLEDPNMAHYKISIKGCQVFIFNFFVI